MSITEIKAGMQRFKIRKIHIASRAGVDQRTVAKYLETGEARSVATEQAIVAAFRELINERSVKFALATG
jgi:hypothetical protein